MKFIKACCASALLLAVSACSMVASLSGSGPVFPPLETGKGRVVFYRTSTFAAQFTPEVLLNGDKVGKLDRDSVFYRDVPPGSYAVTTTMTAKVVHFALGAGEKKYVKFNNDWFGSHAYAVLVEPAQGESESSGLSLMGPGRK